MKASKFTKSRTAAALTVVALMATSCSVLGGSTLTGQCSTSVKNEAAQYVSFVDEQIVSVASDIETGAQSAAAAAVEAFAGSCTADEFNEAASLFIETVGAAAQTQDVLQQGLLYVGIQYLCVSDFPSRENVELSETAARECETAAQQAPAIAEESVDDPGDSKEAYTLMYSLSGIGQATVLFLNAEGSEDSETVTLPWAWEQETKNDLPAISAQMVGEGNVTCSIFVNGELRSEEALDPEIGFVTCSHDISVAAAEASGDFLPSEVSPETQAIIDEILANQQPPQP